MSGVLVDTCVLLDVVEADTRWLEWSLGILEHSAMEGPLLINSIVYAELSIGYDAIETLEDTVKNFGLRMLEIPREALFLAGKAFLNYRRRKGTKVSPLPDFSYQEFAFEGQ